MADENENLDSQNETVEQELEEVAEGEELDATALKAKLEETEKTNKQLFERAKKAEAKLEKSKIEKKAEEIVEKQSKEGELGDAILDFFELKGYGDDAETEVFSNIMKKTGMSHREVIKDEYALAKIESLRKGKEVKEATPSGKRRAGGQSSTDVDALVAKYEQTGEFPQDFDLRLKVTDKLLLRGDMSKPSWQR